MRNFVKNINWLFVYQIITHLSIIPMIIYGQWYHYAAAFIVYFFTGAVGMSGTYHRFLSHRSYIAPKWWEYFGSLCGTIGGTGSTIAWCAVHREHHRYTDTNKDPHSPHDQGIFRVQFLSMFHEPNVRYVPDLLRNRFHIILHKNYWLVHFIFAVMIYTLFDWFGLIYLYLFPNLILWHAGSSINTLSHILGTQDYKTNDSSKNHWFTGIFVWGEGWHNNHHYNPRNMQFGEKWWQIDITAMVIKFMRFKRVDI